MVTLKYFIWGVSAFRSVGIQSYMDFPFADPPGIIRANQKDEFVQNDLVRRLNDVLQSLKGVRFTHKWGSLIQTSGTITYLTLTTLAGSRTLGEEYTDVLHLTQYRTLPSKWRLSLYVLTTGLAPLIIPRLALRLKSLLKNRRKSRANSYRRDDDEEGDDFDEEEEEEDTFLERYLTPTTITSVNLAVFYLSGAYYQVSKRIFGLRYVFAHRVDPDMQVSGGYELISVLMIISAVFKLVSAIRRRVYSQAMEDKVQGPSAAEIGLSLDDSNVLPFIENEARHCNLCLQGMRAPTVTLCGHIFCWSCVSEWCREHEECPLCRQQCHEQHLLELRT